MSEKFFPTQSWQDNLTGCPNWNFFFLMKQNNFNENNKFGGAAKCVEIVGGKKDAKLGVYGEA